MDDYYKSERKKTMCVNCVMLFFGIIPFFAMGFGFANLGDHNCTYDGMESVTLGVFLAVAGSFYLTGAIVWIGFSFCCGIGSCKTGIRIGVGALVTLFSIAWAVVGIVILAGVPDSCSENHPSLWGMAVAYVVYVCFCVFCPLCVAWCCYFGK